MGTSTIHPCSIKSSLPSLYPLRHSHDKLSQALYHFSVLQVTESWAGPVNESIVEPLSGKIFLMGKFPMQIIITAKVFPISGRAIINKQYHGNMPILTKLVGSNFICFNFIFIAATTKLFADANKIDTRSLHITKKHKSAGNIARI